MRALLLILLAFGLLLGFYVIAFEARVAATVYARPLTTGVAQ